MSTTIVHIAWEGRTTFTLDDQHVVWRDGVKLGDQGGDFTPFLIELDGERHVLVAGESLDERTRYAFVNGSPVRVNSDVPGGPCLSAPVPFIEGVTIVVAGKATPDGDEPWRLESPPLTDGPIAPVFGPGWTWYAPLAT